MEILANNSLDLHTIGVSSFKFINLPEGRKTYNLHDKTNCDNSNKIYLAMFSGEIFSVGQARPVMARVTIHGGWARRRDPGRKLTGYNCGAALSVAEIALIIPLITG